MLNPGHASATGNCGNAPPAAASNAALRQWANAARNTASNTTPGRNSRCAGDGPWGKNRHELHELTRTICDYFVWFVYFAVKKNNFMSDWKQIGGETAAKLRAQGRSHDDVVGILRLVEAEAMRRHQPNLARAAEELFDEWRGEKAWHLREIAAAAHAGSRAARSARSKARGK